MNDALKAFAGRRVLVTGHTGFKGSWLALWLHELGAEVTGFALPPEHDNGHFRLLGLDRLVRHVEGDIRDLACMRSCVAEARPEIVFHLAAQALVRRSYADPHATFATNLMGGVNLLEAVRSSPDVRALVYITSDKCYENKEWVWGYRETDELGGRDPYSASKACGEIAFSCYLRSFLSERDDLGAASCRAGNVIGGGDRAADRLVPDIVRALEARNTIELRHPRAIRPWQHVLDPLRGYLMLAAGLLGDPRKYSGAWNFGPGDQAIRDVDAVARGFIAEWGCGAVHHVGAVDQPHEATLLHLACDKALHGLGWRTRFDFDQAVGETARWYRDVHQGADALDVSRAQLTHYTTMDAQT